MRCSCLLLVLVSSLSLSAQTLAQPAPAQSSTTTHIALGQSVIALNGPWKFRTGDDPQWSDPNFDDSQWETVDLTPNVASIDPLTGISGYVPGWTERGHPGYWGYAWYRIRVRVDARPGESLALAGPSNVDDVYQVFANGALLGSFGKFAGHEQTPVTYYTQPVMFQLPQEQATGPEVLELAFRVWTQPNTLQSQPYAGGFHSAPQLGQAGAVTANYQLARLRTVRIYGYSPVEAALFFLLAIMASSLILFDRSDAVYWWLTGVLLLTAINAFYTCLGAWTQSVSIVASLVMTDVFLTPLILGGWVMVWWAWFRLRRPAWMPKAIAALTVLYVISNALGEGIFFSVIPHPVSTAFYVASVGIRILLLLSLALMVFWGIREQGWEGWLALPAVVLVGIAQFQTELIVLHVRVNWFPFGVRFNLRQIAELALVVVLFVLLIRRLLLSLRRQRELALDVKQAQEVQHVLIPEELPQVAGLAIESEYRPAREVGGDFFQILPHPTDGSALIVAGDVTGKGLRAGMLVALIVGAIRTSVEKSFDPMEMIQTLNRRLCGRGHAHATCLALRIAADGSATLANAGHMPPYLNGKELPVEGSLPLGMIPTAEFTVMRFQLKSEDRLMLVSDGVAEAQDEEGHLFGFERIRDLLATPIAVAELASAAQAFGQQDDISVIAIRRVGAREAVLA